MRLGDRAWLGGAALALGAAFLEPRVELPRRLFEHVVVFDITQSMNVTDMLLDGRPLSRLDFARQALRAALPELPCGAKLGLAVFTEYRSFLLFAPVEVCANRAELRAALDHLDGSMAWAGNSEVAKGLHSAVTIAKALPGVPSIVFVTDGHEAPPLNPRHRPRFDDKPGEVAGVIVGVGDTRPAPIPKFDPSGRPLGAWKADEVLQTDPRSQGRGGSVGGEAMVEQEPAPPEVGLGATPGAEHLSGLREPYLQLLAGEGGFAYHRLRGAQDLLGVLRDPALARPVTVRADARVALAALALALLLVPWLRGVSSWWRSRGSAQ